MTITFFSKGSEGLWGASRLPREGFGTRCTFQPLIYSSWQKLTEIMTQGHFIHFQRRR